MSSTTETAQPTARRLARPVRRLARPVRRLARPVRRLARPVRRLAGRSALVFISLLIALSGTVAAQTDRGLFTGPTWTINNASSVEGNSSAEVKKVVFAVTLEDCDGGVFSSTTCSVDWTVKTGTAVAGTDFSTNGTGSFSRTCPANKECRGDYTLTQNIYEDTLVERDETYTVTLSNAKNSKIIDGTGIGTIRNDDFASVSIQDVTDFEGEPGGPPTVFQFKVTLDRSVDTGLSVSYETSDNSAKEANADYYGESDTLLFSGFGGEVEVIEVEVPADLVAEPSETFFVDLLSIDAGARPVSLGDALAVGTIMDSSGDTIFFTGFESGSTDDWSQVIPAPAR